MKKGKILTNPLIRSVLRHPFAQHEAQALARDGAVLYVDGAAVNTTVYGGADAEAIAFYRSLNSALAAGILPACVLLSLTLPETETERDISGRMERFQALAARENLAVAGGHTTVSDHVTLPVMTVTVSGRFAEGYPAGSGAAGNAAAGKAAAGNGAVRRPCPGDALMMTGAAGECGAALMARSYHEKLAGRFSEAFLEGAALDAARLSVRNAAEILLKENAVMHDVSEGGVFSALYTFAEGHACGFTADLKKIPVCQETIEICDYLGVNPYELLSTGALLFSVPDGEGTQKKLQESGIFAEIIGVITEGRRKILLRGEEERFLERPAQDPVMRLADFG
ncbi:MAG: hypothetical protein IKR59_02785 [Lachnospiraceae bacterium]|nr:hypothetical protein [Lachnospiraceae bacterium]